MVKIDSVPERILWALLLLVMGGVGASFVWHSFKPPASLTRSVSSESGFPVYGRVPEFTFQDSSGRPFSSKELEGHVWVVDFIFTRCSGQCPLMNAAVSDLQARFDGNTLVKFVSISVDPGFDTPQRLSAYAANYGANPGQWFFLTGEREAVTGVVRDGFRLALEEQGGTAAEPIMHSNRLILVDAKMQIRFMVNATQDGAVDDMAAGISRLLAGERA